MTFLFSKKTCIFIAVGIFLLDGISKFLTHTYLPLMTHSSFFYPYGGIGIFKNFLGVEFSISHTVNAGAAWGILAHYQDYLLVFRLFLVGLLLAYLCLYKEGYEKRVPLTLLLAGAIGNILDRFVYGHVVDMFHFILWGYDFPVFNVADVSIFFGIGGWVLLSMRNTPKERDICNLG